jgi:hypothetical protein
LRAKQKISNFKRVYAVDKGPLSVGARSTVQGIA